MRTKQKIVVPVIKGKGKTNVQAQLIGQPSGLTKEIFEFMLRFFISSAKLCDVRNLKIDAINKQQYEKAAEYRFIEGELQKTLPCAEDFLKLYDRLMGSKQKSKPQDKKAPAKSTPKNKR